MIALNSPKIAHHFLISNWPDLELKESMVFVGLDKYNFVVAKETIFIGGRDTCICDPYIVFECFFRYRCDSFLLAHNHPNGNSAPSEEDKEMADQIKMIAAMFNVRVGNMVVTNSNYHVIDFFD